LGGGWRDGPRLGNPFLGRHEAEMFNCAD
jgi:hypothetical protein